MRIGSPQQGHSCMSQSCIGRGGWLQGTGHILGIYVRETVLGLRVPVLD